MKSFFPIFLSIMLGASFAFAKKSESYSCKTEIDLEHGFDRILKFNLSEISDNGHGQISGESLNLDLGKISVITVLNKQDASKKHIFDLVLGYISSGGATVTGVQDPGAVERITAYEFNGDENEIKVFRLYNSADAQIGGTLLINGHGTACLP